MGDSVQVVFLYTHRHTEWYFGVTKVLVGLSFGVLLVVSLHIIDSQDGIGGLVSVSPSLASNPEL